MRERAGAAVVLALLAGAPGANPLDALLGPDMPQSLPAERAFAMRVVPDGPGARLELDIAPGHYLYRDKLRVRSARDGADLPLRLPPGERVHDAGFGDVEVYRGRLAIAIDPITGPYNPTEEIEVHYQGCADGRLCYAPARRVLRLGPA